MNWVTVLTCLMLITTTLVQADENNEIDETRPIRIDPILRKALLKALSTLEKESEEEKLSSRTSTTPSSGTGETSKPSDELLEESTAPDAAIQFHSFVAQPEQMATESDEIIKTVVVSAPQVTLMPPQFGKSTQSKNDDKLIITFDHLDPVKHSDGIKIETIQQARSVSSSVNTNNAEDTTQKNYLKSETPKPKPRTTTTTTTTTTTPAPIYNADGENIEKVKESDVQIFQAPLVTAFTIQQDEFGMPRNVIPLLKPANSLPALAQRNNFSPPQVQTPPQAQFQPLAQAATVSQIVPSQQLFPGFFDQRNRELEQQVLLLQNQNRQQEVLLNRQRYLEEQRQNQISLEQRLRIEEENRIRAQRLQQQQQQQQQQQVQQQQLRLLPPVQTNNVQFVPSISLNQVQSPPQISPELQLPIREPIDFLAKTPQSPQFSNSIQPLKTLLPPLLPTVQQPPLKSFQNFVDPSANNIIPVPENLPQLPLAPRTRVFRQESGTANFGRQIFQPSQNFPTSQNFQPQQHLQQQRQQQQNYNFNRQFANTQLQNLFFQNGITPGRSQEDLNIIAKVLSLNHGISHQQNNFIDEPRRFVRHASYYYF